MSGMTTPSYNQAPVSGDFLTETVALSLEFLSDIIIDIQTIGEFTPDREFFWNRKLSKLTADIGQFVELTTLLSKLIMSKKNQTIPGIKESHIHLLFIVKAMNQAHLRSDALALDDLIKYELKDNLTQWKIDLIPQIKKLLTS